MLNTWMSKPQLPGQGEQGRRLGIKHGLNRRWETGGHTHTRVFGLFFRFHLRRTRVVGSRSAPLSNGHSRLHPANPLMHKISKVTIPRAMRTAGPRKQRKAKLRGSRAETRTQTARPPDGQTALPVSIPARHCATTRLRASFGTKVSVLAKTGKTLQGLLSDQWAHHCQHHGTRLPAGARSVVSPPSCPICYCLISSAKEPLPCQLSVPSVPYMMAAAQQPSTALLPGTRLPSLPQSANTGSRCWQRQPFITTTLTRAGLLVISLLS